jgi:DNA-binding CsgD family transcriptional regulator
VELKHSFDQTHPGVPIVLLESGSVRDGSESTGSLNSTPCLGTNRPLDELVTALCDPGARLANGLAPHGAHQREQGKGALSSLSDRELSVLRLVVGGRSNHETAAALGISRHTVRTHIQNIMAKLLVRSRTELVSVAMRAGIRITADPIAQDG